MVLLHPETDLINTSGNEYHYLGFGYGNDYRKNINDTSFKAVEDIGYASGAAIMMRTDLIKEYGFWDEDYFMYHEDTDYSLRMKMIGKRVVMVQDSEFFHKYQFAKSIQKYYWIERNRYTLLFLFYKWPTLLILLPMLLVLEVGLFLFSVKGGWAKEKMKVYAYWLKPENWKMWLKKRKEIQKTRIISDRQLLAGSVTGIYFQEKSVESPLLLYIGNPIMRLYYLVVVRLFVWW